MTTELGIVIENNRPVVSSRKVAEVFEKEHKHVMEAIRDLESATEFAGSNFQLGSYKDRQNQERPEYLMTRDGFTLLAVGFTGAKAMQFKIKYIETFNAMEKQIAYDKLPDFTNPIPAARAWADQYERATALEMYNKANELKVAFANAASVSNDLILIRELAKNIKTERNRNRRKAPI